MNVQPPNVADPIAGPAAPEAAPVTDPGAIPDLTVINPPPAHEVHKPYRVWIYQESGDCLWRIAEKVYGDRSKWRLIYLANRDIIRDPNKIYPKQRLKIPPSDWKP